ncbi:MAG: FecCD family ABC transporter permease [Christensenellales bacterium]|jgi:iron complex transport system permease protein
MNPHYSRRLAIGYALLPLLLAAAACWALLSGSGASAAESLRTILGLPGADDGLLLFRIRMPRVAMGIMVGATLAVCGVMMQGMFRNPLADPHILGVSSGAGLGATVAIALGLGRATLGLGYVTLFAFVGGAGSVVLVYLLSRRAGRLSTTSLLLAGIAVGSLFSAGTTLIMRLNHDKMDHIIFWTMGSLSTVGWKQVLWCLPFCVTGSLAVLLFARDLNLLSQGEETALHLGVNVGRTRMLIMMLTAIATAGAVSATGVIGFVGLIIPHVSRMIFGPDHRRLVPLSALVGAVFMLIMDTLARTLAAPLEIPVGILTAMCGGPFFLWLLRRSAL